MRTTDFPSALRSHCRTPVRVVCCSVSGSCSIALPKTESAASPFPYFTGKHANRKSNEAKPSVIHVAQRTHLCSTFQAGRGTVRMPQAYPAPPSVSLLPGTPLSLAPVSPLWRMEPHLLLTPELRLAHLAQPAQGEARPGQAVR